MDKTTITVEAAKAYVVGRVSNRVDGGPHQHLWDECAGAVAAELLPVLTEDMAGRVIQIRIGKFLRGVTRHRWMAVWLVGVFLELHPNGAALATGARLAFQRRAPYTSSHPVQQLLMSGSPNVCVGVQDYVSDFLYWWDIETSEDLEALSTDGLRERWFGFPPIAVTTAKFVTIASRCLCVNMPDAFPCLNTIGIYGKRSHRVVPMSDVRGWLSRNLTDGVSKEQRALITEILESGPGIDVYTYATMHFAQIVAPHLPSRDEFIDLDVQEIRVLEGEKDCRGYAPSEILRVVKLLPKFDPSGKFSSHLCVVGKAIMADHPVLWKWPVEFVRYIEKTLDSPLDRHRFIDLAENIAIPRIEDLSNRDEDRIRFAIQVVMRGLIRAAVDSSAIYAHPRNILPERCDLWTPESAIEVIAVVISRSWYYISKSKRPIFAEDKHDKFIDMINGAIRRGVFEPSIPSTHVVRMKHLREKIRSLSEGYPDLFPPARPKREKVPRIDMTESDVVAMQTAIVSFPAKDQSVFYLMYTLGLRSRAIQRLKLAHLWDGSKVLTRFTAKEKFSVDRVCIVVSRLREALTRYINEEYDPQSAYLFGCSRRPNKEPKSLCNNLMKRLCMKAHIHSFNPHKFRRNIVRECCKEKNGLSKASKYLGHRSIGTTYKDYYDVDIEQVAGMMPFFDSGDGVTPHDTADTPSVQTSAVLEAQQERIRELENRLRVWERTASDEHRQRVERSCGMDLDNTDHPVVPEIQMAFSSDDETETDDRLRLPFM